VEITEHAQSYVKDYDKNPNWSDPKKRPTMEMKTVLRALLNWADKSGVEHTQQLREALQADEPEAIEGQAHDVELDLDDVTTIAIEDPKRSKEQNLKDLGFEEEEVIQLIDPMGEWAVGFAAKQWNTDSKTAAKELGKKKLGKKIDKKDFIQIVRGEPEAA